MHLNSNIYLDLLQRIFSRFFSEEMLRNEENILLLFLNKHRLFILQTIIL